MRAPSFTMSPVVATGLMAVVVCAAGGPLFASCYLDTDGLTGRRADGGSDAAVPNGDAGDAGDAGTFDACAGAVLCDDFERADVTGDWFSAFTNSGGTVDLDTTTFTSPHRSFKIHLPTSGAARAGLASKDYANVAHVRVAFAMKTTAASRQMSLFRLSLAPKGTPSAVFDLFMLPDSLGSQEQIFDDAGPGVSRTFPPLSGFQPNAWQRWTMELDATVTPAIGVVTLDGIETLRTPMQSPFARGTLAVTLGAFDAPSGPAQDVFYDDVTITILP